MSRSGDTLKPSRPDDDPDDDVRPSPPDELRDEDLDRLAAYVDSVRDNMQFEVKQHDQAYANLRLHNNSRCVRLRNMGCKILRDHFDGPHADVVVEPPLYVLLNLCGTFLDSVDVMWALIRRGMAEVRPSGRRGMHCPACNLDWKSNPSDCRVCLCEMAEADLGVHLQGPERRLA